MNLSDFEEYIESKILQRGNDYYRSGAIMSIEEKGNGEYKAVVEGTDNYSVTVKLGLNDEILFSRCSCPYDMGPVCKHEAAVYYVLRKMNKEKCPADKVIDLRDYAKKKDPIENESSESRFHRILSSLSKEELTALLASLSVEYPEIGKRMELLYASETEEQEIRNCIALIHNYIDKNSERDGFISYENAFEATEGARLVMERAEEAIDRGQYTRAVNLYLCVIREMMPLLNHADDSDGFMGGTIEEALNLLVGIPQNDIPKETMSDIFEKLISEAARKYFGGWPNWRLELLETCAYLAVTPALRNRLEKELDSLIKKTSDEWSSNYINERVVDIRYSLIKNFDGKEKADEFLESNLNYPNIREKAINKALSEKDYARAEVLALDGEEKDKGLYGHVNKWMKYRYEAYAHSGKIENQRQLALAFILKGDSDFYHKLKKTYTKDEWPAVYPGIIKALEEKNVYLQNYVSILIEEKELDKLLAYVKVNLASITYLYKHLLPVFKEEVYEIFLNLIQITAQNASSRGGYKQVCEHIKLLIKAGGVQQARDIIPLLISAYPRRPAFRDELSKIKLKV